MTDSNVDITGPPSLEELKQRTRHLVASLHTAVERSWLLAREGAEISRELGDLAARPSPAADENKKG
jgi:SRSO17 transposase